LTQSEKIAGRKFRDEAQARLTRSFEEDPPRYKAPNFLSFFRHECPGRKMISTAIELKEVYVFSPAYCVSDGVTTPVTDGVYPDEGSELIPASRFGFIYKEGKCRNSGCGETIRSPAGKFVDAYERPPIQGRVARAGV
jgi:hypothetical protein